MSRYVRVLETGEIEKVYFSHREGVAYVGKNGVRILYNGEYEELPAMLDGVISEMKEMGLQLPETD